MIKTIVNNNKTKGKGRKGKKAEREQIVNPTGKQGKGRK